MNHEPRNPSRPGPSRSGFEALTLLRRIVAPALASVVFFVSCQQLSPSGRSGASAEDSVRVALRLGAGSDTLATDVQSRAKWLRVQFATVATDSPLVVDTIVPLTPEGYVSPAFPKTQGYSATVTGLDGTFRTVWGGGATRHALGPDSSGDRTVPLAVPLTANEPLKPDSASVASGAIDFPRTARIPSKPVPGVRRVCSLDSVTWSACPRRLRIDSTMRLLIQVQSLDTLTGAPFSRVIRQAWTAKPVAAPVWRLKRREDLPGKPLRATLRSTTRGAKFEWSTDSGRTWVRYKGWIRIRAGKTYLARALKAHQGESPAVEFSLRRNGRGSKVPVLSADGQASGQERAMRVPAAVHGGGASSRMPHGKLADSIGVQPTSRP